MRKIVVFLSLVFILASGCTQEEPSVSIDSALVGKWGGFSYFVGSRSDIVTSAYTAWEILSDGTNYEIQFQSGPSCSSMTNGIKGDCYQRFQRLSDIKTQSGFIIFTDSPNQMYSVAPFNDLIKLNTFAVYYKLD